MNDSEKPFACNTVGCNMSFVNEDHLTVHKKKHDMMLNLGINNKSNFFIADQTPTPTRFIRNCEEVGLFQDLQHDNPFDETFRRAVEAGKGEGLTVLEVEDNNGDLHTPNIFPHITEECTTYVTAVSTRNQITKSETLKVDYHDDSLHTPNIFPHITEESTTSVTAVSTRNQITKSGTKSFTESSTIIQTVSSKEITVEDEMKINEESTKINIGADSKENETVHTVSDSSSDNSYTLKSETHLPINGAEMQLILKTQDGKVLRFVAAPVVETHIDSISAQTQEEDKTKIKVVANDCVTPESKIIQSQKLSMAKMKLKEALTKNGTVPERKIIQNIENKNRIIELPKERSSNSNHNSRKQSILERNRASSMRSRAKRKVWVEELQQSLRKANDTNANLQDQVKNLHTQVAKLKALLLAHKDCPVTKAMEKGNGIVVGSKVLTIKPNGMKQVAVVAGSAKSTKRPSTEKLIVPKKKPLILSTVKNPVILPKSETTTNAITLQGTEAIKSIPTISIVAPLVTNAQSRNAILSFLRSEPGKVPLIQDTFSLNQNFNENAASKTTGT